MKKEKTTGNVCSEMQSLREVTNVAQSTPMLRDDRPISMVTRELANLNSEPISMVKRNPLSQAHGEHMVIPAQGVHRMPTVYRNQITYRRD